MTVRNKFKKVNDSLHSKMSIFVSGVLAGIVPIGLGMIVLGKNESGYMYGLLMVVVMFIFIALGKMSRKEKEK